MFPNMPQPKRGKTNTWAKPLERLFCSSGDNTNHKKRHVHCRAGNGAPSSKRICSIGPKHCNGITH